MARSSKASAPPAAASTAAVPVKPKGTQLANVDNELAAFAQNVGAYVAPAAGNRIKVLAAGTFELPGGENIGNSFQAVVVDFVGHNKYYDTPYREGSVQPPACYAVGRAAPLALIPGNDAPRKQNPDCATCPKGGKNAFGTGQNGKGKACQNRFLVALVIDDPNDPEAMTDPKSPIYLLDLSPSNIKSFEGYVNGVARSIRSHPVKMLVTVSAAPMGTYAEVVFSDPVPNPNYALHWSRRDEIAAQLERTPDFTAAAAAPPPSRARARRA